MTEPAVRAKGLRHVFAPPRGKTEPLVALDGVDLEVARGEVFGLLGPNGGGKTTTFRILTTMLAPTSGSAEVLGLDVARRAHDVRARIGVVFQNPSLDRRLRVIENLRHHGRLYGLGGAELESRIEANLARFGMTDRAGDVVETLSGGLRRRAELAQGLLHKPELLILDEPSTGLDPAARRELWNHLHELRRSDGMTVLATTHLMDEAEKCDRLAILDRGRIVALGRPDDLKSEIGGDVVTVTSPDPAALAEAIKAKFGHAAEVVDDLLRVELPNAHAFVPQLVEAFPGRIRTVTLGKPTLEDVFIHRTRHRFEVERA